MDNIDLYDELGEIFNATSYTDNYIEIHSNFNNSWTYADFKLKIQQIQEKKLQENKILKFINFNFPHTFAVENLIDIKLEFEKCKFNHIDNRLTQNNKYYFKDCEINSIYFQDKINSTIVFEKCVFKQIKIINCYIMHRISFKNSIIENDFYLTHSEINKKADFSNVEFKGKSYFNRTIFLDYADFHEAIFSDIVSFYDVKFEKLMNFSSSIFRDFDKVNFVNTDIEKISIEKIEGIVDKKHKNPTYKREKNCLEEIKNQITDKEYNLKLKQISFDSKIRWINNFRNSFRIIKHILLETNNSLDAQKFHKLELYAKEIELEYKSEKEYINFANRIDEANQKNINFKEIACLTAISIALIFAISKLLSLEALVVGFAFLITYISLIIIVLAVIGFVFICIEKIYSILKNGIKYKEQLNDIKIFFEKENAKKITDFSLYIDYLKLKIYRITSDHHTNFLQTFNFTISVIALYGLFTIFIGKNISLDFIKFFTLNLGFTIFLISILFYFTKFNFSAIVGVGFVLIFCWLGMIISLNITILGFYSAIIFFATLYIFSLILLCFIFSSKKSLIIFSTRLVSYCIFLVFLFYSANLIIPFSNFNSNSQNQYLQTKLSQANKTEIIELASIINPEFNATKNPNSSENLSISELNEYKKFIVENKEILKDSNATNAKFKQAIYADSSRDKTIKCISFIYAIILGLCLFSLQKTARRNSVVPS
ncbi:pentapeptide repeat-containing protein [Campylobacter sp. VBCF_06 NA8]|uniref:pentapeptide repeat-containing protein n=1 Tax=Campylobacter sp. VBCF_06 NA8 TaxID=2983822 RepID=UPI0022E9E291|nr:pentapeptide repeat-containing protein [Campylobacter sp. VBCF_06 NA8]MDA3046338.1 pentapeptide repeat-containing protein [Campylobacter sp. VBCF_06 NA8]